MKSSAKIVPLRPRTLTSQEALIESVREEIFASQLRYADIAFACGVSPSTVGNLASGKTRWPRATTLFPIIHRLGFDLALVQRSSK